MIKTLGSILPLVLLITVPVMNAQQAKVPGQHSVSVEYQDLSGTQDISSAPWVAHVSGFHLFEIGKPSSVLVQELAENGNPEFILGTAVADIGKGGRTYGDLAVGLPNLAGKSRTVVLKVDPVHPMVSGGWMLAQTNDGFAGIDALNAYRLTKPLVILVYALDAGTEKNTETKADTLGGLGRIPENGVIARHTGIRGNADIPASYKFDAAKQVGRITITPLS